MPARHHEISFSLPARRQPILLLEAPREGASMFPGLSERIRDLSAHPVVSRESGERVEGSVPQGVESALDMWQDLEAEYNSVCVGLVAEGGPAIRVVSGILIEGQQGGPLPGAIALLGYDAAFVATCLTLGSRPRHVVGGAADAGVRPLTPAGSFEWPPMMIFLPANDRALGECARACRKMRAAGIPVDLGVMDVVDALGVEDTSRELVAELDAFFDAHLTAYFPKLL